MCGFPSREGTNRRASVETVPGRGRWARIRDEAGPTFRLALPSVLAELGWMAMGTVDTFMVGRVSAGAIGAVGLGSVVFLLPAIFAIGVLLGLDTLVSQAFGARRFEECHRWLWQGVWLSLFLSLPLAGVVWFGMGPLLAAGGLNPEVLAMARPYLEILAWSLPPLLLYTTFRRYLQGLGRGTPVAIALVTANLVNLAGNWLLIHGHLGFPALGVNGSAWATVVARVYMAAFLLAAILWGERRRPSGLRAAARRPERERLAQLFRLGLPAALQLVLEIGVFAAATALVGRITPAALAAHQIALTAVSITFMVPLGIASAGAVRVGQAVGRHDPEGAGAAGWAALLYGGAFMFVAGIVFVVVPRPIVTAFTSDGGVTAVGVRLLLVGAAFQIFDGLQVVATGVMRGLGDTRTPMMCNLVGHWLLGLPLGWALCFPGGMGVVGLWIGLSAGLIAVGAVLVFLWARHVTRITRVRPSP